MFTLLLVAGEVPLDFEFLRAEQGVKVQFTHFVLVDEGLEFGFESFFKEFPAVVSAGDCSLRRKGEGGRGYSSSASTWILWLP